MMRNNSVAISGAALAVMSALAAQHVKAFEITSDDWKFSFDGNINVAYIYSSCQTANSTQPVTGGLACTGSQSGSSVSNVSNGLLPAALDFGVSTTQDGYDISAHFGLYPGIATNDTGSPNLGPLAAPVGSGNTALGTTGLDVRQVYLTFGNKDIGTFTLGRNFGLFGFDAIINDITIRGVGVAGSSSTPGPANTTLGSIGLGYIYVDTLAQIDYTTPDFAGFNFTIGIFDPLNSLSDPGTPETKKQPGFHGKLTYTTKFTDDVKFYASATFINQKQAFLSDGSLTVAPTSIQYTGQGEDVFTKLNVGAFEFDASYYYATGLGTTAFFLYGDDGFGHARKSDGYLVQGSYTFGRLKLGVNYGVSKLDFANVADAVANPNLVRSNGKVTGGSYYSLTKSLTLVGEVSSVTAEADNNVRNKSYNVNVGAFLTF
jgi:predicted porin